MILEQFADWLEEQEIGIVGTNIFIGEIPKETEDAIMILSVPSTEPDKYTGVEYQNIDIWARYKNDKAGWEKLDQVFQLIHRTAQLVLPDYQIENIRALGRIDDFDRDIEQRKIWTVTFELIYRRFNLVS